MIESKPLTSCKDDRRATFNVRRGLVYVFRGALGFAAVVIGLPWLIFSLVSVYLKPPDAALISALVLAALYLFILGALTQDD